jgi:hypothetical protein
MDLLEKSSPVYEPGLALFSGKPTDVSYSFFEDQTFTPIANLDSPYPIEIVGFPSQHLYTHPSQSQLYIKLKLVKKDNSVLEADKDPITVSEALFCNLFKTFETYVNGQLLHSHGNDSNYPGFLMTLLDTTAEEKKNSLSTQMWYPNDSKTVFHKQRMEVKIDITKKIKVVCGHWSPFRPFYKRSC